MSNNDHYLEYRQLRDPNSLPWDLAHHIYMRANAGKILILADAPEALLALLQKNLAKLCRQAQTARLQTDNAALVAELTRQITVMQHLQPTALLPIDCPGSQVFLMQPDGFDGLLPYFSTLYVTCKVDEVLLDQIVCCMPPKSLMVRY